MNKIFLNNIEFYLPKKREHNLDVLNFSKKNKQDSLNIIDKIGIKERRVSSLDELKKIKLIFLFIAQIHLIIFCPLILA